MNLDRLYNQAIQELKDANKLYLAELNKLHAARRKIVASYLKELDKAEISKLKKHISES